MARRDQPKRKRIAVVVGTEMACFREALRGINGFAATEAAWHIESLSPFDDFVSFLQQTKPDGLLLGQLTSHEERVAAVDLIQHCVSVIGQHSPSGVRRIPEVEADDEAVGEMAAKFFFEKGFKSFAFMGTNAKWSHSRWLGFQRAVASMNLEAAFMQKEEGNPTTRRGWERPHYGDEIVA
jgi:DNA-binding LacI/PurR family transcriptional regulator